MTSRRHSFTLAAAALALSLSSIPAAAQTVASASSLKGAYWVRYLGVNDGVGDLPVSFSGTMTFDGNGNFTVTGTGTTTAGGSNTTLTPSATGTYAVQPSGAVSIGNPFDSAGNCVLYGGVGVGGIVSASSTDTPCLDLFVAIPQAASLSTATLTGNYWVGGMEFASGSLAATKNLLFSMAADGKGGLGSLTVNGSSQPLQDKSTTQTNAGGTYTLTANGSGTLVIPAPTGVTTAANQLIAGTKVLYVSADGNFFIAGGASAFDMQIGVKAFTGTINSAIGGPYFTADVENCGTAVCGSNSGIYAFGGSVNPVASVGAALQHQRINGEGYVDSTGSFDYDLTFGAAFSPQSDGTFAGNGYSQVVGVNGNQSILVGGNGDYFLTLWQKVPTYSGSGVFVNPVGVINASSSTPFTAQWAPGELISIYGTGLAASTSAPTSLPFPTTFNNVQVKVNGTLAPMTVVSATQINAIIPFSAKADATTGLVSIQVINNGVASNVVTNYIGITSPGVSTVPDPGLSTSNTGGIGIAAMLHQDGITRVTVANPAKQGETVSLYLTGLGALTPGVTEGVAAPSSPLSHTTNAAVVWIHDDAGNITKANVGYAGVAPGLAAGANQINFTIPTGLAYGTSGATLFTLEIDMTTNADADNVQARIPIVKQ